MEYRVYNTGDQVWVSQRFGKTVSVKVITHDGLIWEEGDETCLHQRNLEGMEKYLHQIQTFLTKLIFKLFQ